MIREDELLHAGQHRAMVVCRRIDTTLHTAYGIVERLDVVWRCTTAAAYHVDEAICGELAQIFAEVLGCLIIATHRVRQARVRICVHIALRDFGQTLQEGVHLCGSQCAVKANAERLSVHHGDVEGLRVLARERPTSGVDDRSRDEKRQFFQATLLKEFAVGVDGSSSVQGIKNRLNENDVAATGHEARNLLLVGVNELHVGHVAE
mmetsp:Transcript_18356/g.22878  ORF Transcript_18356/g.22878 Transcript_18356/m.22878 type:complete len:206 (+) Transcript_18356:2874-3491(+)